MVEESRKANLNDVECLKAAKRQQDIKLELLKARYREDMSLFTEARVDQIFKNSGAREYIERLKDRTKTKDDIITMLREDLEFKIKEIAELEEKCKRIESTKEEYLRYWKESQIARERLESELQSAQTSKNQRQPHGRHHQSRSTTSSLTGNYVLPPPAIDVPSIEEILRSAPSNQVHDSYTSLDSSIPPPPPIDVPIDELLRGCDTRAFKQEQGELLCRVYAIVNIDSSTEVLTDIIELVEAEQSRSNTSPSDHWKMISNEEHVDSSTIGSQFHVTLIRGHRVIYHHQISPLLDAMRVEIRNSSPFRVCLDQLKLFYNHEKTKQFLCLASHETDFSSKEARNSQDLRQRLRDILDQFASRKTEEDETDNTLLHCSLMRRDVQQIREQVDDEYALRAIENLCTDNLPDYPMCIIPIGTIHVQIGNHVYSFDMERKLKDA